MSHIASFVLALLPQGAPAAPAPELLGLEALNARMRALESANKSRCAVITLGRSRAGREILALRIADGEPEHARPAVLLVANLDGPQVFSSAVALWIAERFAAATDDASKGFLAGTTLYVVPRLDPDAAEARFATPRVEVQASGYGVDNDRDGRQGEDERSDVDGDGLVTTMRKLDPEGEWMEDPADPRVLVKADRAKGERGRWKLYEEGRDNDHDELPAEDGALDAWVNRNFPSGFVEHDARSGLFATDEPEARALCEFVLAHKDIGLVLCFGAIDDLVDKPKAEKEGSRGLPVGWIASDADYLAELGKRYATITGNKTKGTSGDEGSFQAWAYAHRGIFTLAVQLWDLPLEAPKKEEAKPADGAPPPAKADEKPPETSPEKPTAKPEEKPGAKPDEKPAGKGEDKKDKGAREPSEDSKRLKWIDATGESWRFVPWHAFEHPDLGDVEIGGFAPYARSEPPESERTALAQKQLEFLLTLAPLLPRARVAEFTYKDLGGGLLQLDAAIENPSFLPLSSASAMRNDAVRPARVDLKLPSGAAVVSGKPVELVPELAGSGGRKELRWLVRGADPQSIVLEIDTDDAGRAQARPEVKR